MVTVYTKPNCPQCDATKRELVKRGIDYVPRDVSVDADALLDAQELGHRQLPVVVNGDDHWSGFRPDKIAGLEVSQ